MAKVQKNFGSERTVNFPARKLGNFPWPVKTFEKRREASGQIIIAKQLWTQTLGRTTIFSLKKLTIEGAIKTLTQMIYVHFYCLFERSEVWKLVTIDKSETVSDDGYSQLTSLEVKKSLKVDWV